MQLFGLVRNGLQYLEYGTLRIGLHVLGQLGGRQADGGKGSGLILGHGRTLDQSGGKTLECSSRYFRACPGRKKCRAEGCHLRFRKAAAHGDRAHALDDFAKGRGRGVHVVGKMIHSVSQRIDLWQSQIHACPPVGHHFPCLIAGQVKGHPHLGSSFRKFCQVLLGHTALPGSGNDGGYTFCRHRDTPGHIHDSLVHGLEFGSRLKTDNLRHIGHCAFKGYGLGRGRPKGSKQGPGGQSYRGHRHGQRTHALPQRSDTVFRMRHAAPYSGKRPGHHINEGKCGEDVENFHRSPLLPAVDHTAQRGEKTLLQPDGLPQLDLPFLQIIRRPGMEPVQDQRVPLAYGIRPDDQFPRSLEIPTPLMSAVEKLVAMPG